MPIQYTSALRTPRPEPEAFRFNDLSANAGAPSPDRNGLCPSRNGWPLAASSAAMLLAREERWPDTMSAFDESVVPRALPTSTTETQSHLPMQALWPKPNNCESNSWFDARTVATILPLQGTTRQCVGSSAPAWSRVREAPPKSSGGFRRPRRKTGNTPRCQESLCI